MTSRKIQEGERCCAQGTFGGERCPLPKRCVGDLLRTGHRWDEAQAGVGPDCIALEPLYEHLSSYKGRDVASSTIDFDESTGHRGRGKCRRPGYVGRCEKHELRLQYIVARYGIDDDNWRAGGQSRSRSTA